MKKLILVLISIGILCGSTCSKNDGHYCINVVNKSNKKITILNSDTFKCFDIKYNSANFDIPPLNSNTDGLCLIRSTWEGKLSSSNAYYPIFFYNRDSVINLDCDTIAINQPYYKKIILTLDYLNQNNWTITYP